MIPKRKTALATALCAAAYSQLGLAQLAPPTILQVDVQNLVQYFEDTSDVSKFASTPDRTTPSAPKNFGFSVVIGDIVAVNGQPAKGTMVRNYRQVTLTPAPISGQAIADIKRGAAVADTFEILTSDGIPIGSIMSYGLSSGSALPGAPPTQTMGNFAITGGTGAFLGVRGSHGGVVGSQRAASVTEDPANRRLNGGTGETFALLVIPMFQPQILTTAAGPVVFHSSDFSPVTTAKPAKAGEVVIAMATGLGPTRPGVNPGQPFPPYPANPLLVVNSPTGVTVNGQSVGTINAIGWPGLVDTYRVDFRVPAGTSAGMAAIQLSAAWIAGPSVNIPIQ